MKNPNELETVIGYARMHNAEEVNAYTIAREYEDLRYCSRRLSTIDTQNCNGELTEDQEKGKTIAVYKRINAILNPYDLHWYHQTDPRGAALYISTVELTQANYTSALCVY
jgi:hypothetical protein